MIVNDLQAVICIKCTPGRWGTKIFKKKTCFILITKLDLEIIIICIFFKQTFYKILEKNFTDVNNGTKNKNTCVFFCFVFCFFCFFWGESGWIIHSTGSLYILPVLLICLFTDTLSYAGEINKGLKTKCHKNYRKLEGNHLS